MASLLGRCQPDATNVSSLLDQLLEMVNTTSRADHGRNCRNLWASEQHCPLSDDGGSCVILCQFWKMEKLMR